ncbi:MAG: hypothetical protein ACKPKO_26690 [Candidatus Fonsibacter sp.]
MNMYNFVIKSQYMIDWAIGEMTEVQDAAVFNNMHNAKADFHYQLFKSGHKSYYGAQDLEILDECRPVANVGWLHKLANAIYNQLNEDMWQTHVRDARE